MHDIFIVNHCNNYQELLDQYPHAKVIAYNSNTVELFRSVAMQSATRHAWILSDRCDYKNFDFSYSPPWHQDDQLHVWSAGSQTHGGYTCLINSHQFLSKSIGLTEIQNYQSVNWHCDSVPLRNSIDIVIWNIPGHEDNLKILQEQFPFAKTLRYVGSHFEMVKKSLRYASSEGLWILSSNCSYTGFDSQWLPSWEQQSSVHCWATGKHQFGDTLYIPTVEFSKTIDFIDELEYYPDIVWHSNGYAQLDSQDIVLWDIAGFEDNLKLLQSQYPRAKTLRYVGSHLDMLKKSLRYVKTKQFWALSSSCDYTGFDPTWQSSWASRKQLHCWSSGREKFGDTFYVSKNEFEFAAESIDELDYYPGIVWHADRYPQLQTPDIVLWDFGGHDENLKSLQEQYPQAKTLRYIGSHLDMLKKSLRYTKTKQFWVLSSCCNYTNFDPTWQSSWASRKQLHCWSSGTQKFGDTFYVSKSEFEFAAESIDELDYYPGIIWHEDGFERLPWPINYCSTDLLTALKTHKFSSAYEYFIMPGSSIGSTVDVCLWNKRHLIAYNRNGHVSLCPRDCITHISNKVKDYPYIKYHTCEKSTQKPQDIVFISYDEINADLNYNILKNRFPNASRLHGIEGMVNAIKQAAKQSTTPWVYIVFAKTEVDSKFLFDFNPNYIETPSNYVFHSYNPVLNHSYGHDGIVMYHTKSVVDIQHWGVDFTMSFPVVTIPIISCRNNFNYSKYSAWRTAVREAYKLKQSDRINDRYHLHLWLTANHSVNGDWSIRGAQDGLLLDLGMEEQINNWQWLKSYFEEKYNKIVEQT